MWLISVRESRCSQEKGKESFAVFLDRIWSDLLVFVGSFHFSSELSDDEDETTPIFRVSGHTDPSASLSSTEARAAEVEVIHINTVVKEEPVPPKKKSQLQMIVDVISPLTDNDLAYLDGPGQRRMKRMLARNARQSTTGVNFAELFPAGGNGAVDLLKQLIKFNPNERITAAHALDHPYFDNIRKKGYVDLYRNYVNSYNSHMANRQKVEGVTDTAIQSQLMTLEQMTENKSIINGHVSNLL